MWNSFASASYTISRRFAEAPSLILSRCVANQRLGALPFLQHGSTPVRGCRTIAPGGAQRNPGIIGTLLGVNPARGGGVRNIRFPSPRWGSTNVLPSFPRVPLRSTRGFSPPPPNGGWKTACAETEMHPGYYSVPLQDQRSYGWGWPPGRYPWGNCSGARELKILKEWVKKGYKLST